MSRVCKLLIPNFASTFKQKILCIIPCSEGRAPKTNENWHLKKNISLEKVEFELGVPIILRVHVGFRGCFFRK